jgi:hypothetical protein
MKSIKLKPDSLNNKPMPSRVLTLELKLTFSANMDKSQKNVVLGNIVDALKHEIDTKGIVPDNFDGFTTILEVLNPATGAGIAIDITTGKVI